MMQAVMVYRVFMARDIDRAAPRNQAKIKKGRPGGRPIALEAMKNRAV